MIYEASFVYLEEVNFRQRVQRPCGGKLFASVVGVEETWNYGS